MDPTRPEAGDLARFVAESAELRECDRTFARVAVRVAELAKEATRLRVEGVRAAETVYRIAEGLADEAASPQLAWDTLRLLDGHDAYVEAWLDYIDAESGRAEPSR